jgi:hypothetical protein
LILRALVRIVERCAARDVNNYLETYMRIFLSCLIVGGLIAAGALPAQAAGDAMPARAALPQAGDTVRNVSNRPMQPPVLNQVAASVDNTPRAFPSPANELVTDNCASVQANVTGDRSGKQRLAGCTKKLVDTAAVGSVTTAARNRLASPKSMLPYPDWCFDHVNGGWYGTRHEACQMGTWTLTITEIPSGTPVGGINFLLADYAYTDNWNTLWGHQDSLVMSDGWGLIAGTLAEGGADCAGNCYIHNGQFPPQVVNPDTVDNGEWYPQSTIAAGTPGVLGNGQTTTRVWFTNPAWDAPSTPANVTTPWVRCDNQLKGSTSAGCVFSDSAAIIAYSLTTPYPQLAAHIRDAIANGFPGNYGSGRPLHRVYDDNWIAANRNTACPRSLPRPPGQDCDEYPFANSQEGAKNNPYDIRMIDSWQNQVGGGEVGTMFNQMRVLDGEQFWVAIAP